MSSHIPFAPLPIPSLPSNLPPSNLQIDKVRSKYSWANPLPGLPNDPNTRFNQKYQDLQVAFAEIDGLIAGVNYMDKRYDCSLDLDTDDSDGGLANSSSHPRPSTSVVGSMCYPDMVVEDDLQSEAPPHHASSRTPESPPNLAQSGIAEMATQWTAIRKLRIETETHHRKFLRMTLPTKDPIIQGLRASFPQAKKVRKHGMLLMREILDGYQPTSIKDIFAFTSVSYAMAKRLHAVGQIETSFILADFHACSNAITDRAERSAFVTLAADLWPECRIHTRHGGHSATDANLAIRTGTGNRSTKHSTGPSLDIAASGNFDATSSSLGEVPMVTACSLPPMDACLGITNGLAHSWHDTWNCAIASQGWNFLEGLEGLEGDPPEPQGGFEDLGSDFWSFLEQIPGPSEPKPAQATTDGAAKPACNPAMDSLQPSELRQSAMFLVVLTFCQSVKRLVDTLSGYSLTPKHESTKMYQTQQEARNDFYVSAKAYFFDPRRQAIENPASPFGAVLSATRILTRLGCFNTIQEIQHYMVVVGCSAIFPPGPLFNTFVGWVMYGTCTDDPLVGQRHRFENKRKGAEVPSHHDDMDRELQSKKARIMLKCGGEKCRCYFENAEDLEYHTKVAHKEHHCVVDLCRYKCSRKDRMRKHLSKEHPGLPVPNFFEQAM